MAASNAPTTVSSLPTGTAGLTHFHCALQLKWVCSAGPLQKALQSLLLLSVSRKSLALSTQIIVGDLAADGSSFVIILHESLTQSPSWSLPSLAR